MGSHASSFIHDGSPEIAKANTQPSKADWIVVHAVISGLAIVEVERLWHRFQQLGCNEDGVLEIEVLSRPPASNDIFAKNILLNLVGGNNLIEFRTFLNVMMWAENADLDDKIRGAFNLLNLGKPVSRTTLLQVLRKTYPDDPFEEIEQVTDDVMEQIGVKKQGTFNQDQFCRWIHKLPQNEISEILQFDAVPRELRGGRYEQTSEILSDSVLKQIADRAALRTWHILGDKLGFMPSDIRQFELRHKDDSRKQVNEMLMNWRDREGARARKEEMETALKLAGMSDITELTLY